MVVEFSKNFLKELKKHTSKSEAKALVKKLAQTSPSDGDFVALISDIIIREKRLKSFRYYFIIQNQEKNVISKEELKEMIVKFVALSKKNNQQEVINTLKKDLKKFGFRF